MLSYDERPSLVQLRKIGRDLRQNLHKERPPNTPFYNFGPDLIKWVDILLKDFFAVINHCGNISEKFPVLRGCRQGDPVSAYAFILACEFLAHKIRSETNIHGFQHWQLG